MLAFSSGVLYFALSLGETKKRKRKKERIKPTRSATSATRKPIKETHGPFNWGANILSEADSGDSHKIPTSYFL